MRTVLIALLGWALAAAPAAAHALLEAATPAVGSHLAAAPTELTLRYSGAIDASFSRVELQAPDGTPIHIAPAAPASPAELHFSLPALAAGEYEVIWHVTSTDGHMTQGRFRFWVEGK